MHPGDPSGSPGTIINCRCTEVPEVRPCGSDPTKDAAWRATIWKRLIRRLEPHERVLARATRALFRAQRRLVVREFDRLTGRRA